MSELYVNWSGDKWRSYPQPQFGTMPEGRVLTNERAGEREAQAQRRDAVLAVVPHAWTSLHAIIDRSGYSRPTVQRFLNALESERLIERMAAGATKQGGQPQKLYRRRSTPAAA